MINPRGDVGVHPRAEGPKEKVVGYLKKKFHASLLVRVRLCKQNFERRGGGKGVEEAFRMTSN